MVFFGTTDPAHNTTEPTGAVANSGWQYQGNWVGFLGTTIAPQYFITARHIGGTVGDKFVYHGVEYTTTALFDDSKSDLRIWRVCGTFPAFAELYPLGNEAGQNLVVFGRGTRRGDEVVVGGLLGSATKGWAWGAPDGALRWGENKVESVVSSDGITPILGGGSVIGGNLLKATFDASGGPNEAHLSIGDSSGAVFIQHEARWKLAAINYAVDGPYNTTNSGPGFFAAIFDEGGLYEGGDGKWTPTPDLPLDVPSAFYASRISERIDWINSIVTAASAAEAAAIVQSSANVTGPFVDNMDAAIDAAARKITVPRAGESQFYRLRACGVLRITDSKIEGGNLVLTYE